MTWCWENPMPSGETIYALGGSGADDVWALTDTMVLHGVDGQWVDTMDGMFQGKGGFFTAGPADVWLAAGIRPYASSPASTGALYASPPPSVWHWDGQAWTVAYTFDFVPETSLWMTGIWGSSRRDIWATAAGTDGGALIHFDGTSWSQVSALGTQSLDAVLGSGPNDVWAVPYAPGSIFHFDGKSWTAADIQTDAYYEALSGTGANDVWLGRTNGVARFDGARWTTYPLGPQVPWLAPLFPVALAPGDVWALPTRTDYPDPNCAVGHWDGTSWTASVAAEPGPSACYDTATGWRQGGLVAGGDRGRLDVLTCSGEFQSMIVRATSADLAAVWGANSGDLWAVGKKGTVLHGGEPAGWTPVAVPTSANLTAVWGASSTDVWAVGDAGTAIHWNGLRWTPWPTGVAGDLSAIAGGASDNVWAVSAGLVVHFDGAFWSVVRSAPGDSYYDIAVIARDDVWITARDGFLHWTGSAFELLPSPGPSDATPSRIKAYARDNVWADSGMRWVFHYDGVAWSVVATGVEYHPGHMTGYGPYISKIAGDPKGQPYFLMHGETDVDGNIARLDASGAITPMPKLYVGAMHNGVFVLGNEAWLVGDGGAIEHGYLPIE
jgi:hypothetical protein